MIDPVDMVRQVTPPVEPAPELLERVRNDLMTTFNPSEHNATKQPTRGRRRWVAPIAAAAVLVSAAAGWAAVRGDSSTTTSVLCSGIMTDMKTSVRAVSGDPVVDCSNVWREINGTEPPPMTAYDTGEGGVEVLVDGEAVPDGYVALEPGPYQDTTLIELTAALDDLGSGLASNCFDEAGARDLVQRELTRLGLSDWTIMVDENRPPTGAASCAHFIAQPDQRQVQLIGMPASSQPTPYDHFATELDDRLNGTCVGLDTATDIVRDVASATDVSSYTDVEFTEESGLLDIHTIEDSSATCTRADVNVGGIVMVTLRGPAT